MKEPLNIVVGKTLVRVMRKTVDENTKKERIDQIHEGIVVQSFGSSVRVFNPAAQDKGGDVSPESAEVFSLDGRLLWCENAGERSTAFPIPPALC